eukprot:9370966-Pyramimonas_sp.AAC.1
MEERREGVSEVEAQEGRPLPASSLLQRAHGGDAGHGVELHQVIQEVPPRDEASLRLRGAT